MNFIDLEFLLLFKVAYGTPVLGSSQFSLLPQVTQNGANIKKWSKLIQKMSSQFGILFFYLVLTHTHI
jgi:hypothetical protein